MSKILALFLIIAISSCNSRNEHVRKFEKVLGEQQTHTLNDIVLDFDNFLKDEFQGSFRAYLIVVANGQPISIWTIDISLQYSEDTFNSTDSMSRHSFGPDIIITEQGSVLDSLGKANHGEATMTGKNFCAALNSVKQSDSLILNYLNAKKAIGNISPSSLANGMLRHYNENNHYFAKRIFVMEVLGWGCW
ncbi:MAG: hypothetical protein ACOC31_06090 [Bacteroidota bacterium]